MKNNPITITMDLISGTKRVTYDTMSKKLGVARQTVINYEKNPDIIPCSVLKKLSLLSGATIDELTADNTADIVPPSIADIYDKLYKPSEDMIKAIEVIQEFFFDPNRTFEFDKEIDKTISDIKEKLKKEKTLNIAVCGMASTGKSSLINYILGEKVIPVNCFYGTPAFTYYHHISEKPGYIYGKNDTVIFYESTSDAGIVDKEEKKIIGYHSILLKAYVKNDDGCTIGDGYTIKRIDVYLDNENLKGCTIIDTPRLEAGQVSVAEEILLEILKQDYILLTTSSLYMLKSSYEIDLIKRLIKLERNHFSICPNIVVTHLDLYNDFEGSSDSVVEVCKNNLLSVISEDEKNYIKEHYKNRFLAVDIHSKECNRIFNDLFSTTVNVFAKKKFRILMNNIATVCSLTSKDYSARKNILSLEPSFSKLDASELQNNVEDLFQKQKEEKSKCDMHKKNALKHFLNRIEEITSPESVLRIIKEKKITCYMDLDQWDIHFTSEYNDILYKIDSELDKFYDWFISEIDKLFEYPIENMNYIDAILDGFNARDSFLNDFVKNPYDAEQLKKLDDRSKNFIHEYYYEKIIEIFDMNEITSKERNERLAKIISSRYKNTDCKELFIIDFEAAWKEKTNNYFQKMRETIKILQEYTLPKKRGTSEEAVRRAADYDEASKVIEKIGQRCMNKIKNVK